MSKLTTFIILAAVPVFIAFLCRRKKTPPPKKEIPTKKTELFLRDRDYHRPVCMN